MPPHTQLQVSLGVDDSSKGSLGGCMINGSESRGGCMINCSESWGGCMINGSESRGGCMINGSELWGGWMMAVSHGVDYDVFNWMTTVVGGC